MSAAGGREDQIKCWEKHVEWEFVRSYINLASSVMPIDGLYEYADSFFSTDDAWWLLEFKGKKDERHVEAYKYPTLKKERAISVARRVYKKTQPLRFEKLIEILNKDKSTDVDVKKLLLWEGDTILLMGGEKEDGVFFQANDALEKLKKKYQFSSDVPGDVPSHLFVYPADDWLTRLNACRYWRDWSICQNLPNALLSIDEKDLAVHFASNMRFKDFSEYIQLLATARGYPQVGTMPPGSDLQENDELLFGNVLAYGRRVDGKIHLVPLFEILAAMPALFANKKYSHKMRVRF